MLPFTLGSVTEAIGGTKSKAFVTACFCFLSGIIGFEHWWVLLIVLLLLLLQNRMVFFCIFAAMLGYAHMYTVTIRYDQIQRALPINDWQGKIVQEPDVRRDRVTYVIEKEDTSQQIWVYMDPYPRYAYGDIVLVPCRVQVPMPTDSFQFDVYARRNGIHGVCTVTSLTVIGREKNIRWYLFSIKSIIAQAIMKRWHEPYASLVAGLLYGYRGGLGPVESAFITTGTIHIIAISGYNITLIIQALFWISNWLRISKKIAIGCITLAVGIFTLVVGGSASVVRASLMGMLGVYALQLGRRQAAGRMLLYAITAMCIANPYTLLHDAGFALSVLATIGLLYGTPIVMRYIQGIPNIFGIQEIMATTCAATIMTAPYILYIFERVSLLSILTNVLILWSVPLIMMCSVIAIMSLPGISILSYAISVILMKYIFLIVIYISGSYGATVIYSLGPYQTIGIYMGYVLLYWRYSRHDILDSL